MNILIEIVNETIGYVLVFIYTLVGLVIRLPDYKEGDKNPVILIPGTLASPLIFLRLRRQLIKKGYPVYIPWIGFQTARFDVSARVLEQFILENNLRDIYILGHSSGSLIVTQMGYKGRDRIKKFFAISTPFHGTLLALFIYFLPAGRQLMKGSSFLKNNEINFMTFPNLQCLYSRLDLSIIPGFQGRLGRSDDTEYPGLGHINIIMSTRGVNFILEKLELEDSKDEKQKVKKGVPKPAISRSPTLKTHVKSVAAGPKKTGLKMQDDKKPVKNPGKKQGEKKTASLKKKSPVKRAKKKV